MAEKGRKNIPEAAGKSGNGSKSTPATETNNQYAAIYLDNYIDCLHDLPNDIQRNMSRMQELNVDYAECWNEMGGVIKDLLTQIDNTGSRDFINSIGTLNSIMGKMNVMHVQQEKLQIAETIFETIENKARQLSLDKKNLDESAKAVLAEKQQKVPNEVSAAASSQKGNEWKPERVIKTGIKRIGKAKKDLSPIKMPSTPKSTGSKPGAGNKKHGGARTSASSMDNSPTSQGLAVKHAKGSIATPPSSKPNSKKSVSFVIKKRRGYGFVKRKGAAKKVQVKENANIQWQQATSSHQSAEILGGDVEPLYCLCSQVSYGEMICCDNELCPIEWFHFGCVQLARKPRGNWYCPRCRDGKATLMKQRSVLIKELEAYNREREIESNAKQPE